MLELIRAIPSSAKMAFSLACTLLAAFVIYRSVASYMEGTTGHGAVIRGILIALAIQGIGLFVVSL